MLKHCCCCCVSLSKGAILIGYLGLSLSTVSVITGLMAMFNLDSYIYENYPVRNVDDFMFYKQAGVIFLSIYTIINFVNLIACIFLIFGALQNKKFYLIPFLAVTVAYLFITIGIGILFAFKSKEYAIQKSSFSGFIFLVNLYTYLIVHSLYNEISTRERNYPAFLRQTPRTSPQQVFETTYVKIP